jgi:hypothetical protein
MTSGCPSVEEVPKSAVHTVFLFATAEEKVTIPVKNGGHAVA